MSGREGRKKTSFPSPLPPRRLEGSEERRWPSPTPLPMLPAEDIGRILKQILDRLDAIEKRLERIEKVLMEKQPIP
jgi:hypothetical protein